jgi:hypothetical protein
MGAGTRVWTRATFCSIPSENVAIGRSFFFRRFILRSNRLMFLRAATN